MRKHSSILASQPSIRPRRNQRGDFLVEALISVLVSSILATALATMYTQVRRTLNMSSSQLAAIAIAQGVVDHLRTVNYARLSAASNMTTLTPSLTQNMASPGANELFPRALLNDPNLNYTQGIQNAMGNTNASAHTFRAVNATGAITDTIDVTLAPANAGGVQGVSVAITIRWRDTTGGIKTYNLNSFITPNGMAS